MPAQRKPGVAVRVLPLLLVLLALPGCAPDRETPAAPAQAERWVKTELFFGLSKPGGTAVSPAEWAAFLDTQVTPRFKDGLTVLDGAGQYLKQAGVLVKEPCKVLVLLHPDTAAQRAAVDEIRTQYKQAFQQESVLRVRERVDVSF